jgi:thiol-disulfide isomerase/thioredoxin
MIKHVRSIICLSIVALLCTEGFAAPPGEKKPMVLVVYADWCPLCQKLKPVLALINDKYKGQIQFVRMDVTTPASAERSRREARSLGLEPFFEKNQETTSLVVIRDSAGHEVFRAVHDYDFQHYSSVLDQQLHGTH